MNILFWVPPWATNGDLLFYRNAVKKHLVPQANILASNACSVDFVLPEFLSAESNSFCAGVNVIRFGISDQIAAFGDLLDHSVEFYLEYKNKTKSYQKAKSHLLNLLNKQYDIILLWETPAPFLEMMYPEALAIHQMPGVFSRPPYPHTVTFDPVGIYKSGSLFINAEKIQSESPSAKSIELTRAFVEKVRDSINTIQPFDIDFLDKKRKFKKLVLLPLQVSNHYAFKADTKYTNQTEFLLDVLNNIDPETGVVVTQYVTPRVSDTVINRELLNTLQGRYPNLIYSEEFDRISSISQFLLPLVDEVITCSSSIGLQALAWQRKLTVKGDTFIAPFSTAPYKLGLPDEAERASRVISFLINKYQPLASAVVKDEKFLTGLLREMLKRKRNGLKGLDLFVDFNQIDPDYNQKLLNEFASEKAEHELVKVSGTWSARQAEIQRFRLAVLDPEVVVISFDVFDTLIARPTETPADVHKFFECTAANITNGIAKDFARVRRDAEVNARKKSQNGEITLGEIYQSIQINYGLSDEVTVSLMQAEIEMEVSITKARPIGQKFWEIAMNSGKEIYLVSDMYMPIEVVERILLNAGFENYRKLFLSSNYLVSKKEGGLFDILLTEISIPPKKMLHVGDNKIADVEQAQLRGIKTFRLPRAVDRMRGNEHYKLIYPARSGVGERARSAIAGLTANLLFDSPAGKNEKSSHFHGNPLYLGFAGLGPMLTGYVLWLGRQAKRDGISKLYFLSREGWLLKQIYDVLNAGDLTAIPSAYLYSSRRATRVASLITEADILSLSAEPFKNGSELGYLLQNRFGLQSSDLNSEILSSSGYLRWDEKISSDHVGRAKFSLLSSKLARKILAVAKQERESYLAYIHESGLSKERLPGIVDIGWRGNIQGALGELIGRPINGYYYATLQGGEKWKLIGHNMWSFMGDFLAADHPSVVTKYRPMIEYLINHIEPTLICIEYRNNILEPKFKEETNISLRQRLVSEVHQGCIQFAQHLNRDYSQYLDQIWIDPFLSEAVMSSFFRYPSKVDADLLIGHQFEDSFSGQSTQYLIHPSPKRGLTHSNWKEGAEVVYISTRSSVKEDPARKFSLRIYLEHSFVRIFMNKKKYEKYKRDRSSFFRDARNPLVKTWFKFTQLNT